MKETHNDPIKKAALIKDIMESIALIPEAIYRSVYIKECSRIMDVSEEILFNELNSIRRKKLDEKRNHAASSTIYEEKSETVLVEEKKLNTLSPEYQERDIIRLLINYGTKNILIDSEDDEGKPIQLGVSAAYLIVHELQQDHIIFENPIYKTIYNEFIEQLEKNTVPDYNYFINYNNTDINILTVDLISSPYSLSNWEQHSIYITKEEDILKKSLLNAVYALKSRRLEIMIHEIQKKLKENPPEEEFLTLMQTHQQLHEALKIFNHLLGRIVLK
jgi:DNA primase